MPRRKTINDADGQQLLFDADVLCRRCRRRLTDAASRKAGLGRRCRQTEAAPAAGNQGEDAKE